MPRHTPGPWLYDDTRTHYEQDVIRHNGVVIARIPPATVGCGPDTKKDNARLIAAAPELLAALEELLAVSPRCHYCNDHIQGCDRCDTPYPQYVTARAVIAKAKGE